MTMAATLPYTVADGTAASFDWYFGPNDYPILSSLDDELGYDDGLSLTRLIPLGWGLFRWINTIIVIPVFTFLGSFISNYGIIILLLTIFIKLIIFPFTFKSFKSQAKMRVLAPNQGNQREVSQPGRCTQTPAGDNGSVQPCRSEPVLGLSAYVASDACSYCHVLVLPVGNRASRSVVPLGTRPLGPSMQSLPCRLAYRSTVTT